RDFSSSPTKWAIRIPAYSTGLPVAGSSGGFAPSRKRSESMVASNTTIRVSVAVPGYQEFRNNVIAQVQIGNRAQFVDGIGQRPTFKFLKTINAKPAEGPVAGRASRPSSLAIKADRFEQMRRQRLRNRTFCPTAAQRVPFGRKQ